MKRALENAWVGRFPHRTRVGVDANIANALMTDDQWLIQAFMGRVNHVQRIVSWTIRDTIEEESGCGNDQ
jgi:hypothetical protein